MPYARLNKSGCEERKGNVKIRLDFYLEPTDPRYDERYLYLVDTTSLEYLAGYPGKVDKQGSPIDQADYDLWLESLPHIWQNTPFHSHFIYLDADFTVDNIKAAIEIHLHNYYAAFQEEYDKIAGGMRHGWATETRIKPTDYSKSETPAEYDTRVSACQDAIDNLSPFIYKPKGNGGKLYLATEIDIGAAATDRGNSFGATYTLIDKANSANDTGTIDTFEVWALTTMDGTNKVGTFHGSGTSYTNRDGETIGTVTAGAKRTFTGLDCDVTTGDFAGIYFSTGTMERDFSGGSDVYYDAGDQFGTGEQTYALASGDAISLYGTGETAAAPITLELRSSSATRADLTLETSITIAFKSATSTRAAIILDTLVAIHIRSPTATDSRITLDVAIIIALASSTDTRAAIELSVTEVTTLAGKSSTSTRAALTLDTSAVLELRSSTATRADIILSVGVTTLALRSSTDTRASITIEVIAELTRQVGASTDDCFRRLEISWFSLISHFSYVGSQVADYDKGGMGLRFTNILVPQGKIILEAKIKCKSAANDSSTTVNTRISAEDVDDAPTFADDADAFDARWANRTAARVDWDSIPSWTLSTWYDSPEIKAVIQEIINRGGWVSGNDIVIFLEDFDNRSSSGAHRVAWHYDEDPDEAPKLYIKWTSAAPIALELRSSTPTRSDITLDTIVAVAFKSTTATRASIAISITAVTELAGKSLTDTRATLSLDTGIALAVKSSTDTRSSLILDTGIVLTAKSTTDTRAAIALATGVAIGLKSSTDTRASITIAVTAITYLECKSSTDTRASLALDTLISLELTSQTDTRAALALAATIFLELRSSTASRAALALTVAIPTALECASLTATRAVITFNTLILLALVSQTDTRADLELEAVIRHQWLTMAMPDRTLTATMPGRTLTAIMPDRTLNMKVKQNE